MKKLLAVTLVVTMMIAVGLAQTHSGTYVNNAAVAQAASSLTPALTVTGQAGYLPVLTDATGDMGDSTVFQYNAGSVASPVWKLGIGTTTPANTLSVVGAVSASTNVVVGTGSAGLATTNTADIVLKDGGGNSVFRGVRTKTGWADQVSTGFFEIGLSGDNVAFAAYQGTKLSRLQLSSNVTQIGGGYYNSIPAPISGDLLELVDGSNNRRLVVQNAGNVGIGTTAPTSPLTVSGVIQSTTGGFKFPDGTTLTSAATTGVHSVTAADSSVTVAGTAVAPTVAVNTATIQARVTGTCAAGSAVTGVTQAGNVNCGTVGAGGTLASVPVIVAQATLTGSYGLGTAQTIYTPTTTGFYRVSVYMNSPTPFGTCTTLPCYGEQITLQWNDGASITSLATANCSLVAPCASSVVTPIWVQSGQAITAYGQSNGSGTNAPTGGTYNAYVLVEQL